MRVRVWAAGNMSANIAPHLGAFKLRLRLRPLLMGVAGAMMMIPFFVSIVYFLARLRGTANRADDPNQIAGTLSQLKNLHDSGDLSDAEYDRQRDRVLAPA